MIDPYWQIWRGGIDASLAALSYPGAQDALFRAVKEVVAWSVGEHANEALRRREELPVQRTGSIAVVDVQGVLYREAYTRMGIALDNAMADPDVEAVVMRIDSPGGSTAGLSEFSDRIYNARGTKPLIAHATGTMASAAYRIGSQADSVFAGPMELVGSIGTITMLTDMSGLYDKLGIETVVIDTAPVEQPFKSIGAPGAPVTEEQRAEVQRIVDQFGQNFIDHVSRGRGMDEAAVRTLATGGVWLGSEAVELGLIDGTRTFDDTLAALRESFRVDSERRERHARAKANAMRDI